MTEEQFKEAKAIRNRISSEQYHLTSLELDLAVGGRGVSLRESSPEEKAEELARDLQYIEKQKERIALLQARFAAL